MNTIDLPATVEVDARNRAWRTFVQGLGIDVLAAVVVTLLPMVTVLEWSLAWWLALGLAVSRSALGALVAYLARKLVTPSVGAATGEDLEDENGEHDVMPGGYL